MRTLIISGGPEGLQRVDFEDKDAVLFYQAVAGDVERHNALCAPEDKWTWYEPGTMNDPTITTEEKLAKAFQAEMDRVSGLSAEDQAIELEYHLDALANEADTRERKARIRGQSFDGAAWFSEESQKIRDQYAKVVD